MHSYNALDRDINFSHTKESAENYFPIMTDYKKHFTDNTSRLGSKNWKPASFLIWFIDIAAVNKAGFKAGSGGYKCGFLRTVDRTRLDLVQSNLYFTSLRGAFCPQIFKSYTPKS